MGDVPERLRPRRAALVSSSIGEKWVIFECPCERGHRVMLNLDSEHHPHWRVGSKAPLTLSPSVDEISEVGHCHYFIRDGRVRWVERTE